MRMENLKAFFLRGVFVKSKILCFFVLICLLFTVSCQTNTDIQTVEKKEMIREWKDVSTQQYSPSFHKKNTIIVSDPYKEVWNSKENYKIYLSRFYKDINDDTIPELFIKWFEGTGASYVVYRILKTNYLYLGSISFSSFQLLDNSHFGFKDIDAFLPTEIKENGNQKGSLEIYEFNGLYYSSKKKMDIDLKSSIKEKIFTPDKTYTLIKHPIGNTLLWSPKDDDKYRKMIK